MTQLFGRRHTRRELAARTGSLAQFAGVQLSTLGDGVERGIRCLEFRTGTGFSFRVLVDRSLPLPRRLLSRSRARCWRWWIRTVLPISV